MNPTLVLTVGTGAGGDGAALWGAGGAPAVGQLAPGAAEEVGAAVEAALRAPPGLLLADSDVEWTRRERRAAEVLAGLVAASGMQAIRDALVAAQSRSDGVVLAVDARTDSLRGLPWELLAGLPPGRSPLAVAAVVRLSTRDPGAAPAPGSRVQLRVWAPERDDPVVRRVVAEERRRADGAGGRIELVEVPAEQPGPAPTGPPGPAVLHLVSHGRAGSAGVGLVDGGGLRAAETVARVLAPWTAGCVLALADVCEGASPMEDPADSPAWRLALSGIPMTVGPATRWAAEASAAFRDGLFESLLTGASLLAAVEEGRGRLRRLAIAHPSARWWIPQAIVATPLALDMRVVRAAPRIPGWPEPAAGLGEVLDRAVALAHGYLGVEHLLRALADAQHGVPPDLAVLRPALRVAAERCPPVPMAGEAVPTPRVQAIGTELADGFDARALARRLALVPWLAAVLDPATRARLLAPAGDDGRGTLPLEPEPPPPVPAGGLCLEVEGGPDDGRTFALEQPGDVVGRWDPGRPDDTRGRLYVGRPDADRTLSRRHLVLVAGRRVQLRGASRLWPAGGEPRGVTGEVELRPGDRLLLGASTRLRVC